MSVFLLTEQCQTTAKVARRICAKKYDSQDFPLIPGAREKEQVYLTFSASSRSPPSLTKNTGQNKERQSGTVKSSALTQTKETMTNKKTPPATDSELLPVSQETTGDGTTGIDMNNLYDVDESTVAYYLKKASHLGCGRPGENPSCQQLKWLCIRLKRAIPFFQLLNETLWGNELKTIQKIFNRYMLDETVSLKERENAAAVCQKLIELIQHILINRQVIRSEFISIGVDQKRLKRMLRLNVEENIDSEAVETAEEQIRASDVAE